MSAEASPARTLAGALRLRAEDGPDEVAFIFVDPSETEKTLTYGQLDGRARAVALELESVRPGSRDPVVLLYPPGEAYVSGLFGCFYAGRPAVPAFPPDPARLERTLPRLVSILQDATARVVLTTDELRPFIKDWLDSTFENNPLDVIATDTLGEVSEPRLPDVSEHALALLQYTSGSTSAPRGVKIRHEHLMRNSDQIFRILRYGEGATGVIWVPPYHDLGLVGGILQPVYAGVPSVMLSPIDFLRKPILWLRAVTRHRGTISGGPNFAYDLCVRRIPPERREGLDLSSWELAFNGGESATPATIDAFSEAFGPVGFRREAMYCSYGLAEATLLVTGGMKLAGPTVLTVDRIALETEGVVKPPQATEQARELVGNGEALFQIRLAIVDPESRQLLPDGHVGEIWMTGPNVSDGYWGRDEDTETIFKAHTADGSGPFLRTGDLGFLWESELFVTARQKDLIVMNGRNIDPVDLERACEQAVAPLRRGCGAAFSVRFDRHSEELVIVYEVKDEPHIDHITALNDVRKATSSEATVTPRAIVFIRPRTLPKTSSGKIQRWAVRDQFLAGELDVVASWESDSGPGSQRSKTIEVAANQ